jgi:MFS family permease
MLRAALADAPGRRFFAAHAQSCLGSGLAYVALPLLAYDRFDTAWAVVAVLLPDLLPAILLGPLLGALVDRWGWRPCAVLADVVRCGAFALLLAGNSLHVMIAGAALAGLGTALFAPAALAGLSQLAPGERRPAAMGLFGALDDLGLTVGPALAALLLAVFPTDGLLGVNAVSFALSGALIWGIGPARGAADPDSTRGPSLLAEARAGIRDVAGRPGVRALIGSSTAAVLCIGMTNVGEVILAREVLDVGGSGLAILMTAGGIGTVAGSLAARVKLPWQWRRAYQIGLACMAFDLLACSALPSFWLLLPVFIVGGFGNGFALVHDRLLLSDATPESLHGRLFALQKTCTSGAFALSFLGAGALIAFAGVQVAFLAAGIALVGVVATVTPRLRASWPAPGAAAPTSPVPVVAPVTATEPPTPSLATSS